MRKERNGRLIWAVLACAFLVLAVGVSLFFFCRDGEDEVGELLSAQDGASAEIPIPSLVPPSVEPDISKAENEASSEMEIGSDMAEEMEEAPYESPVDFEGLWAVNSDVCAWLYIPGADLSLPVLQHPTDNAYYLTHDIHGNASNSGTLFIEDYNSSDFTDMCTVVYGHRMYSGEMFGTLQAVYSDQETFQESQTIVVYLPDREIIYLVFAAVPYDDSHILYYNDFRDQLSYRKFINSVYASNGIGATLDEDLKPHYGERLLILSTCLWGDKDNRYLVLAKEQFE